jgi:hypothetical protein
MKVGDLVRLKPEAAEGDAESIGIGVIIRENTDDWGKEFVFVNWFKSEGRPWMRYKDDLELVTDNEQNN